MRHRRPVKTRPTGPSLRDRLVSFLRAAWRPCLIKAGPVLVLLAAAVCALYVCRARAADSPVFRAAAPRLSWPGAPAWWEKAFENQINRAGAVAQGQSMLDSTLPERVARSYQLCPWVKRVRSVRKQFPNRIQPDLELRLPAAAVACGSAYYLIGDDGVQLPRAYTTWPVPGLAVPVITGVASRPPRSGEAWRDPAIRSALQITQVLRANPTIGRAIRIASVDVSNSGGRVDRARSEFLVYADGNCVIEWGRAPGTDRPGELPVADKLAKFERFLAEGNPTADRTLDLRFAGRVVISRRTSTDGHES